MAEPQPPPQEPMLTDEDEAEDEDEELENEEQAVRQEIEDGDEDDLSEDEHEYMLGFAEEAPPAALLRHRFPSKIGGRPAWLDPVHLPSLQQLTCPSTGKPLTFLLQIYAALDDDAIHDDAFHRSLFMFITPDGRALQTPGAVRVFRCQLPRKNDLYSYHPPEDKDLLPQQLAAQDQAVSLHADPWRVLDAEAATSTSKSKSKSRSKSKAANSSAGAGVAEAASALDNMNITDGTAPSRPPAPPCTVLWPELELVVEPEERETEEESAMVQRLLAEYQARVEQEGELDDEELPQDILNKVEDAASLEQRHFAMFQARTELAPDQVVRYCFSDGAKPLWPGTQHVPQPDSIPPCPHCGKQRRFEFQVMPQLLNELEQDELSETALDWNTLVVYSCPASCQAGVNAAMQASGSAYVEEYVWVQPAV